MCRCPLFVTIVEALHALEPSANSAYYLGILNDKRGNMLKPFAAEESIGLETDPYKKAKTLYKIALELKAKGESQRPAVMPTKPLVISPPW